MSDQDVTDILIYTLPPAFFTLAGTLSLHDDTLTPKEVESILIEEEKHLITFGSLPIAESSSTSSRGEAALYACMMLTSSLAPATSVEKMVTRGVSARKHPLARSNPRVRRRSSRCLLALRRRCKSLTQGHCLSLSTPCLQWSTLFKSSGGKIPPYTPCSPFLSQLSLNCDVPGRIHPTVAYISNRTPPNPMYFTL